MARRRAWHSHCWQRASTWQHIGLPPSWSYGGNSRLKEVGSAGTLQWPCHQGCQASTKQQGVPASGAATSTYVQTQWHARPASGFAAWHCTRLQSKCCSKSTAAEQSLLPACTPAECSHEVVMVASKQGFSRAALTAALRTATASSQYQPCCRLRRLAVKIPGCEPADLPQLVEGRDWRSSLSEALEELGMHLYRLSIRAGCIHLVLDMVHPDGENAGPGGHAAVAAGSTASTQAMQSQQADTHAQLQPSILLPLSAQPATMQAQAPPLAGGLAVQVMATAAAGQQELQSGAAVLEALSPEQLLRLLDPGLVAGRQVLLQADWLQGAVTQQTTAQQQDQQQQQQSAWLLTCGPDTAGTAVSAVTAKPQLQQAQRTDGHIVLLPGVTGAVAGARHTTLTLPGGAQLPVMVQPVKVPQQACVDVQAILPSVVPAFHKGTLVLHVLAHVPANTPTQQPAAGTVGSHGSWSDITAMHSGHTDALVVPELECYVRGDGGYLPASCTKGRAQDIQHLLPENVWPQVCWQLQHGNWQVVQVQVQLQQSLPPGLLHLELTQKGAGPLLGRPGLILVAPSQNAASELSHLGADVAAAACAVGKKPQQPGGDSLVCEANVLLRDLGLLLGCLHRMSQPSMAALPSAGMVQTMVVAQHQVLGAVAAPAWASCVAVRLLIAAVARAWPACTAMLGDALRVLGTNWQDVEAAALQQEQVSMLHLVVRSGCPATAAAALAAGCAVGHAWRLTALPAEQHHLTALHLAAVLPDQQVAAAMVELLLHGVQGAPRAWRHALCGGEAGSSPADMALAVGNKEALAVATLALGDAGTQLPTVQSTAEVEQDSQEECSSHDGTSTGTGDIGKQQGRLHVHITNPAGAAPAGEAGSCHVSGSEASCLHEEDQLSPLQVYQQQQAARQQQQVRTAGGVASANATVSATTGVSSSATSWGSASSTSLASSGAARSSWGHGIAGAGSRSAELGVTQQQGAPSPAPLVSPPTGADMVCSLVSPTDPISYNHAGLPGGTMADALRRVSVEQSLGARTPDQACSGVALRASVTIESQQLSGSRQLGIAITDGVAHAAPHLLESMPALHYLSEQQAPHRQHTPLPSPTDQPARTVPHQAASLPTELASPTEPVPTVVVLTPTPSERSSMASSMRTPRGVTGSGSSLATSHAHATTAGAAGSVSASQAAAAAGEAAELHAAQQPAHAAELLLQTEALVPPQANTPAVQSQKHEAEFEGEWDLVERRATPVPRDLRIETADTNVLDLGKEHSNALHALYEGEWDLFERPSSLRASGSRVHANGTATGSNSPERQSASPPRRSATGPMRVGLPHDGDTGPANEVCSRHSPPRYRTSRFGNSGAAAAQPTSSTHQAHHTARSMAGTSSSGASATSGSASELHVGLRQRLGYGSRVATSSAGISEACVPEAVAAPAHRVAGLHTCMAPMWQLPARLQHMLVDAGLMFEDPQLEARYAASRAYAQAGGVDRMAAALIMLLVWSMLFTMLAQGAWVEACTHFLATSFWWGPHLLVAIAHYYVRTAGAYPHGLGALPESSSRQLLRHSAASEAQQQSAASWAAWLLCHRDIWISLMPGPRLLLMLLIMMGWVKYPVDWLLVTSTGLDVLTNAVFKPITSQARSQYALLKCTLMLIPDIHMAWVAHQAYGAGTKPASPWMMWLGAMGQPLAKHMLAVAVQVAFDLRARRLFVSGLNSSHHHHHQQLQ